MHRNGQFKVPAVCQQVWEDLRQESNPAQQFLSDRYEAASPDSSIHCGHLYSEYRDWCVDRGFKPLDVTTFGKELKKAFPVAERKRETTGQRHWRYHGVRAITAVSETAELMPPVGEGAV
jgi:phage/plasmid-associated DNA primase